jgi:hypothetical protein
MTGGGRRSPRRRKVRLEAMVIAAVIGAAIVGSVAVASPEQPTVPRGFLVTRQSLGGFAVTKLPSFDESARFLRARGFDVVPHFDYNSCEITSRKGGLKLSFFGVFGRGTPAKCTMFTGANMSGPRWRTRNDLHVGSPLADVRRLFPKALDVGLGKPLGARTWCADWWLTPIPGHAAHPILAACTAHHRVVLLEIEVVGH